MHNRVTQWFEQLGPTHARFQLWIINVVFVGAIGEIFFRLVGPFKDHTLTSADVVETGLIPLVPWFAVAVLISLGWWLLSLLLCIDLHLYYCVWLLKVKPRGGLSPREKEIISSFKGNRPSFIWKRDLMRRRFWPDWVFAIVVLFGRAVVEQETYADEDDGKTRWKLTVDLTDAQTGIYSNKGKKFLKERFLTEDDTAPVAIEERSDQAQSFMSPREQPGKRWGWNDAGHMFPIRWASGGFLPLVRYQKHGDPKKDYWVLLFFRDLPPVGLNVPNGASENLEELREIKSLMAREFSEEVVILSGHPDKGAEILQTSFEEDFEFSEFLHRDFADKHLKLRRFADGLNINLQLGLRRKVNLIKTPFEVEVGFHDPKSGDLRHETKNDVIYTVNPAEFGIEVMQLCSFRLRDGEYILDGEYNISRCVLIRRPPILLRLSYLHDIFERNGTLGRWVNGGDSHDGKVLDEIPVEHCMVFDADVALRRARRTTIEATLKTSISRRTRENLVWERDQIIDHWLERYAVPVSHVGEMGLRGTTMHEMQLRTMCPVAWKTLELGFEHGLLSELQAKSSGGDSSAH